MDQLGYMMMGENWEQARTIGKLRGYIIRLERKLFRQLGIKEAALAEIARLDPDSPLLRQEVRTAIGDKAEGEAFKAGKIVA